MKLNKSSVSKDVEIEQIASISILCANISENLVQFFLGKISFHFPLLFRKDINVIVYLNAISKIIFNGMYHTQILLKEIFILDKFYEPISLSCYFWTASGNKFILQKRHYK